MEDLSSLEGPPMRDERFSPIAVPISPLSPHGTYDPSRPMPILHQGPVSPISTASRSLSESISSLHFPIEERLVRTGQKSNTGRKNRNPEGVAFAAYKFLKQFSPGPSDKRRIVPLRSSRSQAALRDAAQIPPRPASADNSATAPFWLLVNGRLVWIEDMQLWVLWDEIDAARAYENGNMNSQAPVVQRPSREHGAWKSLPPLPHEIHHLLPPDSPSTDRNKGKQKSRVMRHSSSATSSLLRGQWASLAGQLAPHTTTHSPHSQRDAPRMSQSSGNGNQHPRSLQPGYPVQSLPPSQRPTPNEKRYYYH